MLNLQVSKTEYYVRQGGGTTLAEGDVVPCKTCGAAKTILD